MGTFTLTQQYTNDLYLTPGGDGCNIDLSPFGAANNFQCVDDPKETPDDDTTYVYSAAINLNYDLYTLPNHTTEIGAINYVLIRARAKSHLTAQHEDGIFKIILTENACSNIYKSNDIGLITTYATYNNVWTTNPRTAAVWTWADIDNLQIGIECSSPTITNFLTETLRPNGAGITGIGNQFPNSTAHWDKVDEAVSDGDTTFVYPNVSGVWQTDVYALPSAVASSGVITGVTVFVTARNAFDSGGKARAAIRTHAANYNSDEYILGNDYIIYSYTWANNPNTASAWTWAEITDLQAGLGLREASGFNQPRGTQVYIIVNYTAATNPEIRTTQMYAVVNYNEESECTLEQPKEISVNANQNIKILNFWSGNRTVYGLSRGNKTMVMTGTQYGTNACDRIECVRTMAENGNEITTTELGSTNFNATFRILSFGWKKLYDKPLTYDWVIELEYTE